MGPERFHLQRCIDQPAVQTSTATPACSQSTNAASRGELEAAEETISLEAEVPEVLLDGMRDFLARHPHMDQMQLISSALASFLFQNGSNDRLVTQHYLDGLFQRP
ncbi:MAG: DUF2811 domain-containing protein [Cyanobacteria bacterium K_DeepCast_35m_m2_155]|nr:DUF2811 domain-containing protein [Cyanobacteria bacterium K_DeepCast_35m_m2_155]